jgi:hypothetical protein
MQGLIAHVAPTLGADLERSDPERPWRVLHANLAITAIRTEDAALMAFAFDALDRALPDERGQLLLRGDGARPRPPIAPAVREAARGPPSSMDAGLTFLSYLSVTCCRQRALKFLFDFFPVILFFVAFKAPISIARRGGDRRDRAADRLRARARRKVTGCSGRAS